MQYTQFGEKTLSYLHDPLQTVFELWTLKEVVTLQGITET